MIRGIYASGVGMKTNMNRMDVISNNLANVDTAGFKRELPVQRSFTEHLMHAIGGPGASVLGPTQIGQVRPGNFVDEVHLDFRNGALRQTGGQLDLAIVGDGFFSVSMTDQQGQATTRYTRNGAFTLDSNQQLRTMEGHLVQSASGGPITIPSGSEIAIAGNGAVYVRDPADASLTLVDTIQIVSFENPQSLRQFGDNTFNTTAESVQTDFTGNVLSGHLETSNVNIVREMVEMIAIQRNYEANQRVLTIADTTLGRAVSEIAQR